MHGKYVKKKRANVMPIFIVLLWNGIVIPSQNSIAIVVVVVVYVVVNALVMSMKKWDE
jgi:uncharacterized integral membrane protein